MLDKAKAICLNSLTIAWSYFLALAGSVLQVVDVAADALGEPGVKDQIVAAVGDPKIAGRILLGVSVITILARVRGLRKAA